MNMFKNFLTDESGATAIEYSLIAAGVVSMGFWFQYWP
jgi:Flp pilus assembly pilin Flp